jgi:hypothetical protein
MFIQKYSYLQLYPLSSSMIENTTQIGLVLYRESSETVSHLNRTRQAGNGRPKDD